MVVIVEKRNYFFNTMIFLSIILGCCILSYSIFIGIPATIRHNKEKAELFKKECYTNGSVAYKCGVPAEANPYIYPDAKLSWLNGWMDEKSKLHK